MIVMTEKNGDKGATTRKSDLEQVAKIVIESGADKGKEYLIDMPYVTIGRSPDNDICLHSDERISRYHGQISYSRELEAYYFEDLNSTNGTTIREKAFKNSKMELRHGDRIFIGQETRLRFFSKKTGLKEWLLG